MQQQTVDRVAEATVRVVVTTNNYSYVMFYEDTNAHIALINWVTKLSRFYKND